MDRRPTIERREYVQNTQIYVTQQHAQSVLRGAGTRENGKKVSEKV